jgi:hypothetical protein
MSDTLYATHGPQRLTPNVFVSLLPDRCRLCPEGDSEGPQHDCAIATMGYCWFVTFCILLSPVADFKSCSGLFFSPTLALQVVESLAVAQM